VANKVNQNANNDVGTAGKNIALAGNITQLKNALSGLITGVKKLKQRQERLISKVKYLENELRDLKKRVNGDQS